MTCCLCFISSFALKWQNKIKYVGFGRAFISRVALYFDTLWHFRCGSVTWSLPFVNKVYTLQVSDDTYKRMVCHEITMQSPTNLYRCCEGSDKIFVEQAFRYFPDNASGISLLEVELSDKSDTIVWQCFPQTGLIENIQALYNTIRGWISRVLWESICCKVAKKWVAMNCPKMTNPRIQFVLNRQIWVIKRDIVCGIDWPVGFMQLQLVLCSLNCFMQLGLFLCRA